MTNLEIIELALLAAIVVILFLYYFVKAIKNKWFTKLLKTIETSIKEAEKKFPESGSGNKKKEYVITKVKEKCDELGIPYRLFEKLINITVDKIVKDYNIIIK